MSQGCKGWVGGWMVGISSSDSPHSGELDLDERSLISTLPESPGLGFGNRVSKSVTPTREIPSRCNKEVAPNSKGDGAAGERTDPPKGRDGPFPSEKRRWLPGINQVPV